MDDETLPDTSAADDARELAEFGAGFDDKPAEKPAAKPDKPDPAATPRAAEPAPPKYVQITEQEVAEFRAAAAKTASYDQQLSKAFGTIGNLQKLVNGLQSQTPRGARVEIPKDAFKAMERDFPELAKQTRDALEAALAGVSGTGGAAVDDDEKFEARVASWSSKRELKTLAEDFPEWRTIVGAVDATQQQPDPNNPFRKWLAGKDVAYQTRINASESAEVIGGAIRLFQTETKATPKPGGTPTPREAARAERIRGAVQPRGDNAGAAPAKSDDDEFEAGYNAR